MQVKVIILGILSLIILFSCSEIESQKKSFSENDNIRPDEKMAIINDTLCKKWFDKNNYTHFKPSQDEIERVDMILDKAIKNGEFNFLENPELKMVKEYYRQYICYINENGHKIIRVNAFCENILTPKDKKGEIVWEQYDWKNNYVKVADGGSCYWTIFINIDTNYYFDMTVNGEA